MKLTAFRLLVISNTLLLLASLATARTRPRYGDTLRAEVGASVPSYEGAPDLLVGTVFETLVTIDDAGRLAPGLALTWTTMDGGQRWSLILRNGVKFHDSSSLTGLAAATALAKIGIPGCKLLQGENLIVVECDSAQPNLPALLAKPQYLIFSTDANGNAVGTGPFRLENRDSGRFMLLANDDYWGGRPFLDRLELISDRNPRDQMTDFTFGRADIVEVPADQYRRAQQDRLRTDSSRPVDFIYIDLNSKNAALRDLRLRLAISLAIDRTAIHTVIFQRQGDVAGSLLPNWITGYSFLFTEVQDLPRARQLRSGIGQVLPLTIGYDPNDATEKLIAERIALNTREIGIALRTVAATNSADIRLRRIRLTSSDPATALTSVCQQLGVAAPSATSTLSSIYEAERAALETYTAIPIVHLPRTVAIKDRIQNWQSSATGNWDLSDVWVAQRHPSTREVRP